MVNLIDAHCHLNDERIFVELPEAIESGISGFISSALCQEEYDWHIQNEIPEMKWCAGIHPYYKKSKESDLDRIIQLCEEKKIVGIGEIGLDGRNNNENWQTNILLQQLDIARNFSLPVVFHTVRKYYELYKILKNNFPKVTGYLHGFNASKDIAETFAKFDLAFSIGCKPPKDDCINYIIKRGFYLFETDAPYQKPYDSEDEYNHLTNLLYNVENIAHISGFSIEKLKQIQYNTYQSIFQLK
ncbi:MAG: TatD family hydrolase [Candidatus Cloacimonadota bacterium]|nr:TatD family hydrolase [Candidatus Cloacimonadota bacterium]